MDETENQRLPYLRKKAKNLPLTPGVYIMKNKKNDIIYIGKALALKNRVSSYFGSTAGMQEKTVRMVAQVFDFEYILCDSEYEALMLECSLIKQHMPKYNILLKDDKGFHYIRVSKSGWPKISAAISMSDDGADYIGPYNSVFTVTQTVDEALKVFKLPDCGKEFPRDIKQSRPCLRFFIGQCSGPCAGKISHEDYLESVSGALEMIKGDVADTLNKLKIRMDDYSENLEFEKAARLRDRIKAIKRLTEKQKVVLTRHQHHDAVAIAEFEDTAVFEVFRFRGGRLYDREEFFIDRQGSAAELYTEFITRYYSMRDIPPRIALHGAAADMELLSQWLSERAGKKVTLYVPQIGESRQITEMCQNNAQECIAQRFGKIGKDAKALTELSTLLGLQTPAEYIEAYDISNTAGSDNVAGMVVFSGGKPLKSAYRRFKIKGFIGQDDYASMREVVSRRLNEYFKTLEDLPENAEPPASGFGRLPDLFLLDGGRGHVGAVLPLIKESGLDIPVFGMVKDNHHKTRAITSIDGEIEIKATRSAYTLVTSIQDEVHRFAVAYHHQKHKSSSLSSELLSIEGVGKTRLAALIKHFGSMRKLSEAGVDDILKIKGMSRGTAENIVEYFKGKK